MGFSDQYRFSVHAAIFDENGNVLLLKQTYGDLCWGLPGGGVEPGETVHEAILRECLEELSVRVKVLALTGIYYHSSYNAQVCIFRCALPAGAEIRLSPEHSEYRWANISELGHVQRVRVRDALEFDGCVRSGAF